MMELTEKGNIFVGWKKSEQDIIPLNQNVSFLNDS